MGRRGERTGRRRDPTQGGHEPHMNPGPMKLIHKKDYFFLGFFKNR